MYLTSKCKTNEDRDFVSFVNWCIPKCLGQLPVHNRFSISTQQILNKYLLNDNKLKSHLPSQSYSHITNIYSVLIIYKALHQTMQGIRTESSLDPINQITAGIILKVL